MTRFWLAILTFLLAVSPAVGAQYSMVSSIVTHRLLDGWRIQNGPDSSHMAGVQIALAEGWKTYWRSPGEFGLAPVLEVKNANNVSRIKIHFPRPTIYLDDGFRTIGYADEVVFPLEIAVNNPNEVATVDASLHIGVCSDVCVPVELNVPMRLAPRRQLLDDVIKDWLASGPIRINTFGRREIATCEISPTQSANKFLITYRFVYPGSIDTKSVAVFELPGKAAWFSDALLERTGPDRVQATSVATYAPNRPISISRQQMIMTLMSGEDYVEFVGCYDS